MRYWDNDVLFIWIKDDEWGLEDNNIMIINAWQLIIQNLESIIHLTPHSPHTFIQILHR